MNLQNQFDLFSRGRRDGVWGEIRQNGFKYFSRAGLPSKKQEDWKYTGFQFLKDEQLTPVVPGPFKLRDLKESLSSFLNPQFFNLLFVDGIFISELSDLGLVKKEIRAELLANITPKRHPLNTVLNTSKSFRKKAGKVRQDSLEALNASFFENGLVIAVPPGVKVSKPVQMIFFSLAKGAQYPKVLVQLGDGSELTCVESSVGGSDSNFTNVAFEAFIGKSAKFEMTRVQDQAMDTVNVESHRIFLQENSSLEFLSYATGAKISRHNLDVFCMEPGATAKINGLTMSAGDQHMDNHTNIEHVVGSCTTTQLYKSILEDKSRVVFNGRVHIHQDAQKASSDQLNNNLLLSTLAEADSKPQLEIHADDVKATHGSTVGPLDSEELFYFQSRAVSTDQAMEMLSLGFVKEVIDLVSNDSVKKYLNRHLPAAYRRMKNHGI
jgi:Fe-S cluster assembly protein SufD